MRSLLLSLIGGFAASSIVAQETAPLVKKSLAEGLVRQCIERDKLAPPHMGSGLEMGAGKGDLVLMVRRRDGSLRVEALPRGRGNHGPAAKLKEADLPFVEEEEVVAKPQPGKAKANRKAPSTKLTIKRSKGGVTVSTGPGSEPLVGPKVDRAKLAPQLKKRFAAVAGTTVATHVIMEVDAEATMQDFLTCWEVARSAGFSVVMLSPTGRMRTSSVEERELIAGIPEKFKWPSRNQRGRLIYDGELLILLDGPTLLGEVAPLMIHCAQNGIWQIAFVGQKNAKQRFKLPTHLPSDG